MNNGCANNFQTEERKVKNFKALKIITAILFAIVTVFSVVFMIDIIIEPKNLGTAFALVIWLVFATPANAIPFIISAIGLVICSVKRKRGESDKRSVIYFTVFTALPVVVYLVCILIFNIVF